MAFNQFQLYANNIQLDTYDDLEISLNYQISDITDITTRNTSFSKTIVIPGTPKNNQFFKNIFELNIDLSVSSYNPKVALPCTIKFGDEEVFSGNLQLIKITTNQKSVEYEVIVSGILKNLLYNFGDYFLQDLELGEYNHQRTITNISNSWDYTIVKNGSNFDATGLGEGYVYPFINYGNSQNVGTLSYVYDQYPAIYLKTIMDKLFEFAGYSYTSNFFNSVYFKSLIVPFTSDNLQYSEAEVSGLTTTIGVDATQIEGGAPALSNSNYAYEAGSGGNTVTGYRQMTPVLNRAANFAWQTNASQGYYIPFDKTTGVVLDEDLQNPFGRWVNVNSSPSSSTSYYQCSQDGFYEIDLQLSFIMKYINVLGGNFYFDEGSFEYYSRIILKRVGQAATIIEQAPNQLPGQFQPSPGTHNTPWYDTQTVLDISQNVSNIYLQNGDKIYVQLFFNYPNAIKWKSGSGTLISQSILAVPMVSNVQDGLANVFSVKPVSNNITAPNITIDMNQILPTVKMKDFFLGICKMFNLIVADNPNQSGDLIIEPKDLFYNSRRKIKEWSHLLDEKFDVNIIPMSELDVREYTFQYDEDDDYYNKQYKNETNLIYSNTEVDFLNEFSNEVKDIKLPFAPTPDTDNFISPRVAPFFADLENTTQMKPKKVKPRILFYTGLKTGQFRLQNTPVQTGTLTTYTTYPYCGMWDDPYNPSYDLGWGKSQKIYWNSSVYPNQNLTSLWYQTTLNELQDVNSKLVEAYFYLTPKDLSGFDFRDIIELNNGYYRVNKISDYDPTSVDKTTKVELYKLSSIDFYPPLQEQLPQSAYGCPTDVVAKLVRPEGYIYTSISGQKLGEECCRLLGGIWTNGYCKVPSSTTGGVGVGNTTAVPIGGGVGVGTTIKPTGGFNNAPTYTNKPIEQNKNNQSIDSPDVLNLGFNNYVPQRGGNVVLIGDNLSVRPDVSNTLVIGKGQQATQPNSINVNGVLINGDSLSLQWSNVYIIDGGENDVMNYGKTNLIDIIDGGLNSVRDFGGDSKSRPIIDGTDDTTIE